MSNPRIFDVDEVNRMIKLVSPLVAEIREKHRRVQAEHDQVLILDLLRGGEGMNYDSKDGREYVERSRHLEEQIQFFQDDIIKINRLGCVLKDINRGLVDFFHVRGKELVYLCWMYGEDQIKYWHNIDGDFENRKQL